MSAMDYGETSDADSDLEELQGDIAKFDESVREFLESQRGTSGQSRPIRGSGRARGPRGPRKAAKPRGDITARLSRVNQAFLAGDYAAALDLVSEVIRINAETHQAWTALASIFQEQGELNRALSAMVYAAHLRPKDVSGWMACASFALNIAEDEEASNFKTARLCFSAALRADPINLDARLGKASVCHTLGHYAQAIQEYNLILKSRPTDLDIVRKLAETCVDNKYGGTSATSAVAAYRRYFEYATTRLEPGDVPDLWYDIGIYIDILSSVDECAGAIKQLKSLARWMAGRASETYWDGLEDDREWDTDNHRRSEVPLFRENHDPTDIPSLPIDLRARLAIMRLRLAHSDEAQRHLNYLDPEDEHTKEFMVDFPSVAYDLADEIARNDQPTTALKFFESFRDMSDGPDPAIFLQLGRCYLSIGEQSRAEESFLAAIDADQDSIDARIELANMYERAKEDEEALILAAEAMALRDAQVHGSDTSGLPSQAQRSAQESQRASGRRGLSGVGTSAAARRHMIPRRYRPKRLAGPDKRRQDEQARAMKLSQQYEFVRNLKKQIDEGRKDLANDWMAASKDLVDEFRSLKRFYTWDKYLRFLGSGLSANQQPDTELSLMYQRLSRTLAPQMDPNNKESQTMGFDMHQGISFDDWLNIFLDYAIGLAMIHRRDESYQVCEAAKDSTVFQTSNHQFTIYVAWSACAIYTSDEEKCVAIARHLMREGATTDSYRMFALLSKLCQSPASWYTSGPAQKFILRQIKAIDTNHESIYTMQFDELDENDSIAARLNMDVCLLMLYGHILFTSTSYTYAISYFLRARSLDPDNPMVNLSLGLAYVHYGLKRQSTNRQYLLLQGQAFITQYLEMNGGAKARPLAERYYNVGRLFHLLGLSGLSERYYAEALEANRSTGQNKDIDTLVAVNTFMSLMISGNKTAAFSLLKKDLIL